MYHELSFSIHRIAQLVKREPSAISRELHRNATTIVYRPSIA
ncbi:helix-turn-helix domain-containing protein [Lactiplantibacillus plantarum]|nr:helix-turn-helix domain-containing protein [Lactiplantibacillus plantarum]MBS0945846.1 helix-turn-helix domain-containing protein [Lactiplantibacillus plantarum]